MSQPSTLQTRQTAKPGTAELMLDRDLFLADFEHAVVGPEMTLRVPAAVPTIEADA